MGCAAEPAFDAEMMQDYGQSRREFLGEFAGNCALGDKPVYETTTYEMGIQKRTRPWFRSGSASSR